MIDKNLITLPANYDGSFSESSKFHNNDIDALRHAYVSGIFTREYCETVANLFGKLNELIPGGGSSSPSGKKEENMGLWNNNIGRKYGKEFKDNKLFFYGY